MKRLILLAIACATPVAAQEASDYDRAVAARLADRPAEAVELLDRWLVLRPADSDAFVQRGYAYLALGENRRAERDFRAALALAPAYADAKAGLDLALARQSSSSSRSHVRVAGAWSSLNTGRDWGELSLDAQHEISEATTVGGQIQWYRRFGAQDVELSGRVSARIADNAWVRASLGGTPASHFRPEIAMAIGGDYRVIGGSEATVVTFDGSYQRFPSQNVVVLSPGVVRYFAGGNGWLTVRGIGAIVDGGSMKAGASSRVDFQPREAHRLFVGLAYGPDTDLAVVTRVTSIFAGGVFAVSKTLGIEPAVAHEWRDDGGQRTEIRVGVKAAF